MTELEDRRDALLFKGCDSENVGVQSITQGLIVIMYATNQGPRMHRAPSLTDHAQFWLKDRSTVSRWLKAAEDEGAIIRHDDGSIELVLAEDSPPYA